MLPRVTDQGRVREGGSEPEAELLLLKRNPNWKRIQLLGYDLLRV
jgi:hypothetical protein